MNFKNIDRNKTFFIKSHQRIFDQVPRKKVEPLKEGKKKRKIKYYMLINLMMMGDKEFGGIEC